MEAGEALVERVRFAFDVAVLPRLAELFNMQGTLLRAQAPQIGRTSSHLTCFSLQRIHPNWDLVCGLLVDMLEGTYAE